MSNSASLDFRLVTRICHLQQALDQALWSLEDLSEKADAQEFLEIQLAETEKYANVQHRLICELRQQLTRTQQRYDQDIEALSTRMGALLLRQQMELAQLQLRLQQSHTEVQSYLNHLTIRHQMPASSLEDRQLTLMSEVQMARMLTVNLNAQLNAAQQHAQTIAAMLIQSQQGLPPYLSTPDKTALDKSPSDKTPRGRIVPADKTALSDKTTLPNKTALPDKYALADIHASHDVLTGEGVGGNARPTVAHSGTVQSIPASQQTRIELLEQELAEQFKHQTQLQNRCQRLAAERDFYRDQLNQLRSVPDQTISHVNSPGHPPIPAWGRG